jgi:hypothetical protein
MVFLASSDSSTRFSLGGLGGLGAGGLCCLCTFLGALARLAILTPRRRMRLHKPMTAFLVRFVPKVVEILSAILEQEIPASIIP